MSLIKIICAKTTQFVMMLVINCTLFTQLISAMALRHFFSILTMLYLVEAPTICAKMNVAPGPTQYDAK